MILTPLLTNYFRERVGENTCLLPLLTQIIEGLDNPKDFYIQSQRQLAETFGYTSHATLSRQLHLLMEKNIITYTKRCCLCFEENYTRAKECHKCHQPLFRGHKSIGVIRIPFWPDAWKDDQDDAKSRNFRHQVDLEAKKMTSKLRTQNERLQNEVENLRSEVARLQQELQTTSDPNPPFLASNMNTSRTNVLEELLKVSTETCSSEPVLESPHGEVVGLDWSSKPDVTCITRRDQILLNNHEALAKYIQPEYNPYMNTLLDSLLQDVPDGPDSTRFYQAGQLLEERLETQQRAWDRWKRDAEAGFEMEKPKAPNALQTKARFASDVIQKLYPGARVDIKCVINEIKSRGFLRYIEEQGDFFNPVLAEKVNPVFIPRIVGRS